MTTLILDVRSPDGRTFELLVHFQDEVVVSETAMEVTGASREWRDTRSVLLLVGRKPRGAEGQS